MQLILICILSLLVSSDVLPDPNYRPTLPSTSKCACGEIYYTAAPDANPKSRTQHMASAKHLEYIEKLNNMCKPSITHKQSNNEKN